MKYTILLTASLFSLFLFSFNLFAQAPAIQWQKALGGSSDEGQRGTIQQTSDGGYIIAGGTSSFDGDVTGNHGGTAPGGLDDFWVVKLDAAGSLQWQKALGGSEEDQAGGIRQTSDGGYIVAGETRSDDGDVTGLHNPPGPTSDVWVVKLNASGNILWQKTFGGSGGSAEASEIGQTSDGGYIVAASIHNLYNSGDVTGGHGFPGSGSDAWVLKLDASGNLQWQKALGGTYSESASSIQQTTDGGYIVTGSTSSNDGDVSGNHNIDALSSEPFDAWVVKLNASGNIQWQKALGGTGNDYANFVRQTGDGGYIVAAATGSNDGDVSGNHGGLTDGWVVKLSSTGSIQWQKALGGTDVDVMTSVLPTSDGSYVVGGHVHSNDGDVSGNHGADDIWVVKLNSIGNILWQKPMGGSRFDIGAAVQQTTDGGFIVAGQTTSNSGDVTGNHGATDFWVVKLGPVAPIPTLSEWGLIIFALLLLCTGAVAVWRARYQHSLPHKPVG